MTEAQLEKLSTPRLLNLLEKVRGRLVQYWYHYGYDHYSFGRPEEKQADEAQAKLIKKILSTREHYPRGKEGRKLRQKAKQNR